jgi:hypothetical protein
MRQEEKQQFHLQLISVTLLVSHLDRLPLKTYALVNMAIMDGIRDIIKE